MYSKMYSWFASPHLLEASNLTYARLLGVSFCRLLSSLRCTLVYSWQIDVADVLVEACRSPIASGHEVRMAYVCSERVPKLGFLRREGPPLCTRKAV